MAAWLTKPLMFTGSRMFSCEMSGFTPEQCDYYKQKWHFWYVADYSFALPTVAFFMTGIGIFILGNALSSQLLGYHKVRGPSLWRRLLATVRYLSYRGFHVKQLQWNSAPIGVLLLGLAGATFFFCMDLIPSPYYWSGLNFGGSPPLATRSGWLSLACMPFVFATASKANWLTLLTGVSHERLQVFHRWIAYAFFILALLHTFPFIVYHIRFGDMETHFKECILFYWTGIVAIIFQAWLTFASHSTIRKLGYEFFKFTHLAAVVVFMITFFWHCDYTLTSWHYFVATAAVYVPCYVYPWLRTAFEYGFRQRAHIHVEGNGFTRITIPNVDFRWYPGQHCFLRFPTYSLLSSHPFTICSLPSRRANEKSELVFYIRHQGGLTRKLYEHAQKNVDSSIPVWVDGPYGGVNMQRFNEADNLLVVAGGSGAGWILPFIELFAAGRNTAPTDEVASDDFKTEVKLSDPDSDSERGLLRTQTSGPSTLRVVLATREASSRVWFLDTVSKLLASYPVAQRQLRSDLRVQVHLTGEAAHELDLSATNSQTATTATEPRTDTTAPADGLSTTSSTASESEIKLQVGSHDAHVPGRERQGRPRLPDIVREEARRTVAAGGVGSSALSVYVCGPETMQNDVRNAVARENLEILKGGKAGAGAGTGEGAGGVYLHSEHFSWA